MAVKDILSIAKKIQSKWTTNVVTPRPNEEAQLQSHLGGAVTYKSVTDELTRWVSTLSGFSNKPRVSRAISSPLLMALNISLGGLSNALDHAGNSVDWMCTNRNFGALYVASINLIRELSLDSAREVAAITDAARERISQDISSLQNGSELAEKFSVGWPDLNTKIGKLSDAEKSVTEILNEFFSSASDAQEKIAASQEITQGIAATSGEVIETATSTFNETLKVANEALAEAQKIHAEAQKISGETQSTAAKTKTDLDNSTVALNSAIEKQELTQQRLTKALQNAQMEGLAGSFTRMKEDTRAVITVEQKRFEWALVYLILIAVTGVVIEAYLGFPKTTLEEFGIRMLKMLSLAAPGIWIAWLTSKKLSALNRVFSDYEYKSAAALAYESYRQTVAEAGSDELKQQLLAFAIRSFGENPTHYYESVRNEASSPFESFLEKMSFFNKSKSDSSKNT
ncbi:MAG: hypothetical protein WBK51_01495 [Polaromonas sp.]